MKSIGNAGFLRRRRLIVDVLIGVATLAVVVAAALGATAALLYMLPILGALAGLGLMLEVNVMAQPPAESLRPLAKPKPTRPGPQVIRRIDTAIVDATSV